MLKKVIGILGKVSEIMAMITLAAMTSLVLFQIFNRLFFHITVIWTEEFCRYIFPSNIRSPAKTNIGMAMSSKEFMPAKVRWASISSCPVAPA